MLPVQVCVTCSGVCVLLVHESVCARVRACACVCVCVFVCDGKRRKTVPNVAVQYRLVPLNLDHFRIVLLVANDEKISVSLKLKQ